MRSNRIAWLVAGWTLMAQTFASGQSPIRVATRLVEVNVIVRDMNGPVAGLTKDDSTISDSGVPPISI